MKIQKKNFFWGGVGWGGGGGLGRGVRWGGVGFVGGGGGSGQGVCEQRNEVFVKIIKKNWGGGGGVGFGGVRVDVNAELKFLGKFTKKIRGGGGSQVGVSGWWGGGGSGWM